MKMERWFSFGLITLLWAAQSLADDFDATTQPVGRIPVGLATPVNQMVTPTGTQVLLPGVRPNAIALSPDGRLLIASGLKSELIAIDPATGNILQHVSMPGDPQLRTPDLVSSNILSARENDKLSFTGLVFSPNGSRIYLSNVNGDIKVFSVDANHRVVALTAFPLPPANAPGAKPKFPPVLRFLQMASICLPPSTLATVWPNWTP
jgi:hypothetical protein